MRVPRYTNASPMPVVIILPVDMNASVMSDIKEMTLTLTLTLVSMWMSANWELTIAHPTRSAQILTVRSLASARAITREPENRAVCAHRTNAGTTTTKRINAQ